MDEKEIIEEKVVEIENEESTDNAENVKEASFGKKLVSGDTFKFSVKDIAEIGILVGLAIVFDKFCKIDLGLENGGSINLAMFPLLIIALRQGWFKGFIAGGVVFGIISCLIDGWGFVWYPTDYLIGFGSVAILGVFKPLITDDNYNVTWHSYAFTAVGVLCACLIRYFSCTLSGMLIADYTFVASLAENAMYVFPSFVAVLALLLALLINILKIFRTHNTKSL